MEGDKSDEGGFSKITCRNPLHSGTIITMAERLEETPRPILQLNCG